MLVAKAPRAAVFFPGPVAPLGRPAPAEVSRVSASWLERGWSSSFSLPDNWYQLFFFLLKQLMFHSFLLCPSAFIHLLFLLLACFLIGITCTPRLEFEKINFRFFFFFNEQKKKGLLQSNMILGWEFQDSVLSRVCLLESSASRRKILSVMPLGGLSFLLLLSINFVFQYV